MDTKIHMDPRRARLKLVIIIAFSFPSLIFALVNPRGSATTHDIATWNLQNFPLQGNISVNYITLLIHDLNLDLICVQEIQSMDDFNQLVNNLNGWDGFSSPDGQGDIYYKTGVLYNTRTVQVGEMVQLFADAEFAFIRPPIEVPVSMIENGDTLTFHLIVCHLKAGGCYEEDNLQRRQAACDSLKTYVERQIAAGEDDKWLIAGDLNDTLFDSPDCQCFTVFLDDPQNWYFLTYPICEFVGHGSHIESDRFIDHLLVTTALREEYIGGRIESIRLDVEWNDDLYLGYVSDHRPVAAYFPTGRNAVKEPGWPELPENARLSLFPIPANTSLQIHYSLSAKIDARIAIYNLLGEKLAAFPLEKVEGTIVWNDIKVPSAIYLVRLETNEFNLIQRAVILR